MVKFEISAHDPKTGQKTEVPPAGFERIKEATHFLETDLSEIDELFDVSIDWQFEGGSSATDHVKLELNMIWKHSRHSPGNNRGLQSR